MSIRGYTFLKPVTVHLFTGPLAGEDVRVEQHQTLSLDEVAEWPEAAVFHLQDSKTMVPSAADPTDAKELVRTGMGVTPVRDGVIDVVPSGPSTTEHDLLAALDEAEDAGKEPEPADEGDEGAATAAVSFPHPLGGNQFELSDGSVVSGRAKAVKAQAALEG